VVLNPFTRGGDGTGTVQGVSARVHFFPYVGFASAGAGFCGGGAVFGVGDLVVGEQHLQTALSE